MSIQSIGNNAQPDLTASNLSRQASPAPVDKTAPPPAISGTSPKPQPGNAQVAQAVDKLNKAIPQNPPSIVFSTEPDSNKTVVKVIDQQTKQVLLQIPSEEVIDISKSLDKLQGLLVKLKA